MQAPVTSLGILAQVLLPRLGALYVIGLFKTRQHIYSRNKNSGAIVHFYL